MSTKLVTFLSIGDSSGETIGAVLIPHPGPVEVTAFRTDTETESPMKPGVFYENDQMKQMGFKKLSDLPKRLGPDPVQSNGAGG